MSSQSKQKAYKPTHHNRLKHRKLGAKIRALRRKHGYNQSEFANLLGISASYLNLLEHDRRRLRVELMLDLANLLHINIETLFEDDHAHLLSGAMEVLSDELFSDIDLTNTDIQYLIETSPNVAQALLHLYDSWVEQNDVIRNLSGKLEDYSQSALGAQRVASEIISDYFQEHNNFFIDLEKAAMQIVESNNRHFGKLDLQNYLQKAHGVNIIDFPLKTTHGVLRQYDPKAKILSLASHLNEATKRFALAYQVASLSAKSVIEMLTKEAGFTDKKIKVVADIALSNYLASAILMPYEPFLKSAQDFRYDVELLQIKWNASFEQIAQRLSALNNPERPGIPFHFIKVDMAGNISKRFSYSGMPIPRYGGACARWNIYRAFLQPEIVQAEYATLDDGKTYLCIAKAARKGYGFGQHQHYVAIGLGCDAKDAHQTVYSDPLDYSHKEQFNPVGITCRICERMNCAQRAFAPINARFPLEANRRGLSPFTGHKNNF